MARCFNIISTRAERIEAVLKAMFEFIGVFVESLKEVSPKRRAFVMMVSLNFNIK